MSSWRRTSIVFLLVTAGLGGARAEAPPWRSASPERRLVFPADHASHPGYKIEWWYYTGNLRTADGRRFGYQVTFFRVGVDPAPTNPSRWAVRDLHMAHVAVSDVAEGRHRWAERLNRAGVGWAGASVDRLRVWNDDWRVERDESGRHRLVAADREFALELALDEGGPPVAHARDGYSQKGSTPGNASHYYSFTRMPTRGTIQVGAEQFSVSGESWMDHEFGTSFLEAGQVGWDWFALQLDDGTDLMLYGLRRGERTLDVHSSGTVVEGGRSFVVGADGFTVHPVEWWTSPVSGARYPTRWRVEVPSRAIRLDVQAVFPQQELRTERSTRVTYWEGAVNVAGERAGRGVKGVGYLEMTGYAGQSLADVLR